LNGAPVSAWFTVVGVLGNVRHGSLAQAPRGEMYLPQARVPNDYMYVVARTTLPFETVAPSLREVVRRLDPELPIYRLAPFEKLRAASTARERFSAVTLTSFGLLTLLLAAAGLYGIVAYAVARRTREMGIRLALGAVPAAVGRMLIGEALRLAIVGVSIGLLLALAGSRMLGSLLFGITATDVTTYGHCLVACAARNADQSGGVAAGGVTFVLALSRKRLRASLRS
jgi:putative ABC transport system permease protein